MSRGVRAVVGIAAIAVSPFAGPLSAAFLGVGVSLLGGAVFEPRAQRFGRSGPAGQSVMVRSATEPQKVIYGRAKVSGPLNWFGAAGDSDNFLYYSIVVVDADREIDGYEKLHIDEHVIDIATQVDGNGMVTHPRFVDADGNRLVWCKFYRGTQDQVADQELKVAFPQHWNDSREGKGTAYFIVRLQRDLSEGGANTDNPTANVWHKGAPREIAVTVRGFRVYDPAKDSTAGGSGAHRADDPTTWEWSNNPALCMRDYLADNYLGPGYRAESLPAPYYAAQAAISAEAVTVPDGNGGTVTQPRYTVNGWQPTDDDARVVLESMMTSCHGAYIDAEGLHRVAVGAWATPDHDIDETWLAAGISINPAASSDEIYNFVRGRYTSEAEEWQLVEYPPRGSAAFETADGGRRWTRDFDLEWTTDVYAAQRLAVIELKRGRNQVMLQFRANSKAMQVALWDTCRVSFEALGYFEKTFRCIHIKINPGGVVDLLLREEQASDWTYDLPELDEVSFGDPILREAARPPAPTNLRATSESGGVLLTWTNNGLAESIARTEVYASRVNDRQHAILVARAQGEEYFHDFTAAFPSAPGNRALFYSENPDGPWIEHPWNSWTEGASGEIAITFEGEPGEYYWQVRRADGVYSPVEGTNIATDLGGEQNYRYYWIRNRGRNGLVSEWTPTTPTMGVFGSNGLGGEGESGLSVAELTIYRRATSPPTTPTGGSYDFSTQSLTPPAGWTSEIPSGNDPVYASRGVAAVQGITGVDSIIAWSSPWLHTQEGSAVDIIFRRSATQPATPSPSPGVPAGWYTDVDSVPISSDTLWSSVGTRQNAGQNWTWQVPVRVEGDDGLSVAELAIYRRAASAPSTPTGGSYNFSTQTLTPPTDWSSNIPAGNNPVYTSRAVAAVMGTTGTDTTLTWSAPIMLTQEGAAVDIVFRRSATQPSTPSPSSGVPSGWYTDVNSVPGSADPLWSSVGTRENAGQNWVWQTPIRVEGQDGEDGLTASISNRAFSIQCDAGGVPISGAFTNAVGQWTLYSGSTDVTASATFSGSTSGVTGSVNTATNTPVTGAKGSYRITAIAGETGYLQMTATYGGKSITERFNVQKVRAGTASAFASTNSVSNISSGTYTQIAGPISIASAGSGTLRTSGTLNYSVSPSTTTTAHRAQVKIQYREAGGTYGDFSGTEVTGSDAYYIPGDLSYLDGAASISQQTTAASSDPKVYEFRLMGRLQAGTDELDTTPFANASGFNCSWVP